MPGHRLPFVLVLYVVREIERGDVMIILKLGVDV